MVKYDNCFKSSSSFLAVCDMKTKTKWEMLPIVKWPIQIYKSHGINKMRQEMKKRKIEMIIFD